MFASLTYDSCNVKSKELRGQTCPYHPASRPADRIPFAASCFAHHRRPCRAIAKTVPARDFTVGWVCALPVELAAAAEMMDEEFADLPSHPTDSNLCSFGRIGVHNVVAACLPAGQHGGVV